MRQPASRRYAENQPAHDHLRTLQAHSCSGHYTRALYQWHEEYAANRAFTLLMAGTDVGNPISRTDSDDTHSSGPTAAHRWSSPCASSLPGSFDRLSTLPGRVPASQSSFAVRRQMTRLQPATPYSRTCNSMHAALTLACLTPPLVACDPLSNFCDSSDTKIADRYLVKPIRSFHEPDTVSR